MKNFNQLSRDDMKKVLGGVAQGTCTADCGGGKSVSCGGTCGAKDGVGCYTLQDNGELDVTTCSGGGAS